MVDDISGGGRIAERLFTAHQRNAATPPPSLGNVAASATPATPNSTATEPVTARLCSPSVPPQNLAPHCRHSFNSGRISHLPTLVSPTATRVGRSSDRHQEREFRSAGARAAGVQAARSQAAEAQASESSGGGSSDRHQEGRDQGGKKAKYYVCNSNDE